MHVGLIVLFGLVLGPFVNYAIYAFAYLSRPISPWQSTPDQAIERGLVTKIPVFGWLFRFQERSLFGTLFWIRPLLIELLLPIGLVWLYRYILGGGTDPSQALTDGEKLVQFIAVAILSTLMVIATFIDFDERTIPDIITIPGTLIGLVGSALVPGWRLWLRGPEPLHANSPFAWPLDWNQATDHATGLWIALLIWTVWCFALLDRRWITRRGFQKAWVYFAEILRRSGMTLPVIGLWLIGGAVLMLSYFLILKPVQWEGLLSSLIGLGLGGLLVWVFRIVASWAMQREALGFGDVTLMAMIGAFFGWQIVWIAFFCAPFFGLVFVIISWFITRDNATPFGPYLCGATLFLLLDWIDVSAIIVDLFPPMQMLLMFLIGLLLALTGILKCMQLVRAALETR